MHVLLVFVQHIFYSKYIENTKVQMEEIENMLQNAINSGGNRITEADQGAKLS